MERVGRLQLFYSLLKQPWSSCGGLRMAKRSVARSATCRISVLCTLMVIACTRSLGVQKQHIISACGLCLLLNGSIHNEHSSLRWLHVPCLECLSLPLVTSNVLGSYTLVMWSFLIFVFNSLPQAGTAPGYLWRGEIFSWRGGFIAINTCSWVSWGPVSK